MSTENYKRLNSRLVQKNDTSANWETASNNGFVPLKGEIIIYTDLNKIKIGDGVTVVGKLEFVGDSELGELTVETYQEEVLIPTYDSSTGVYSITYTTEHEIVSLESAILNVDHIYDYEEYTTFSNEGSVITYESISGLTQSDYYDPQLRINYIYKETIANTAVLNSGVNAIAGEGSHTLVMGDVIDGKAITDYSMVSGKGSLAGSKGFKIVDYDSAEGVLVLDSIEGIEVGDTFSCIIRANYDNYGVVTSFYNGTGVYVSNFPPLPSGVAFEDIAEDQLFFCIPSKPEIGTVAYGTHAHAEGYNNQALGNNSHAEGFENIAYGKYSHVEGARNTAHYAGHAEGRNNSALGEQSHAEGLNTRATGVNAHTEGRNTEASNAQAHAEGNSTVASGESAHAEGYYTNATANCAHAEGNRNTASGINSHTEGTHNTSSGASSHSEGEYTRAEGKAAHAEGYDTTASGEDAHAEGNSTIASGIHSHAEGNGSVAKGTNAHAEGLNTKSLGSNTHTEGSHTIATKQSAHAEGYYTNASSAYQHVQGKYNIEDTSESYAHIVGNGDDEENRSNAHTLDWEGNAWFAGSVKIGSDNKELASIGYVDQAIANIPVDVDLPVTKGTGTNAVILNNTTSNSATGQNTVAEGNGTTAGGSHAHAEGNGSSTSAAAAHAEGYKCQANHTASHSEGYQSRTGGNYQHVSGKWNEVVDGVLVIGNGTAEDARSNALVVDWSGNVALAGHLTIGTAGYGSTLPTSGQEGQIFFLLK